MHVIKGSQHLAAELQQPEICRVAWYRAEPDQSKNSSCSERTAFLPSLSDTIKEMLFLDAPWLIIFTLMPSRPSTLKTCSQAGSSEATPQNQLHGKTLYPRTHPLVSRVMLQHTVYHRLERRAE